MILGLHQQAKDDMRRLGSWKWREEFVLIERCLTFSWLSGNVFSSVLKIVKYAKKRKANRHIKLLQSILCQFQTQYGFGELAACFSGGLRE